MSEDRTGIHLTPIWPDQSKLVDRALHLFHLDGLVGAAPHLRVTLDGVESLHEIDAPTHFFAAAPGDHTLAVAVKGAPDEAATTASLRVIVEPEKLTEVTYVSTARSLAVSRQPFEARQWIRLELSFPSHRGHYGHYDPNSEVALWTVHALVDGVAYTSPPGPSHRFPCEPGPHEVVVFFTPKGLGTLLHWNYGMEKIRVVVAPGAETKLTYAAETSAAIPGVPDWYSAGKRTLTLG